MQPDWIYEHREWLTHLVRAGMVVVIGLCARQLWLCLKNGFR